MSDSSRIKISFIFSCLVHLLLFSWTAFISKSKPIMISFPVELITLPSQEKITEKISVPQKKEEIVIPTKKKIVPKEQKKEDVKTTEQSQQLAQPITQSLPSVSLETAKFPFTYYINQIRKKITDNWLWSQSYPGELKTVIYFKILRSGDITELKIKEKSQNNLYNNICLRAIEVSAPFPPLPEGYNEEYLGVYFEFRYKE